MHKIFVVLFLGFLSGCDADLHKALGIDPAKISENQDTSSNQEKNFQIQLLRRTIDDKAKWEAFADVKGNVVTFKQPDEKIDVLNKKIAEIVAKVEILGLDQKKIDEKDRAFALDASKKSKFLGVMHHRKATVYLFLNEVTDENNFIEKRLMAFGSTLIKHEGSSLVSGLENLPAETVIQFLRGKIVLPEGVKLFLDEEAAKKVDETNSEEKTENQLEEKRKALDEQQPQLPKKLQKEISDKIEEQPLVKKQPKQSASLTDKSVEQKALQLPKLRYGISILTKTDQTADAGEWVYNAEIKGTTVIYDKIFFPEGPAGELSKQIIAYIVDSERELLKSESKNKITFKDATFTIGSLKAFPLNIVLDDKATYYLFLKIGPNKEERIVAYASSLAKPSLNTRGQVEALDPRNIKTVVINNAAKMNKPLPAKYEFFAEPSYKIALMKNKLTAPAIEQETTWEFIANVADNVPTIDFEKFPAIDDVRKINKEIIDFIVEQESRRYYANKPISSAGKFTAGTIEIKFLTIFKRRHGCVYLFLQTSNQGTSVIAYGSTLRRYSGQGQGIDGITLKDIKSAIEKPLKENNITLPDNTYYLGN